MRQIHNTQYETVADRLLVNLKRLTRQPFHIANVIGNLKPTYE